MRTALLSLLVFASPIHALAWDDDYEGYPPPGSWTQTDVDRFTNDPYLYELQEARQRAYWSHEEDLENQKKVLQEMKRQNDIQERRLQLEKDREMNNLFDRRR